MDPAGFELDAGEQKIIDRRGIEALSSLCHHTGEDLRPAVVEANGLQQLSHIHMLGRQPPAQDIVRVGHQLDIDPLEVGVRNPGPLKGPLPGLQLDQVHQIDRKDPPVDVAFRQREGTGGLDCPIMGRALVQTPRVVEGLEMGQQPVQNPVGLILGHGHDKGVEAAEQLRPAGRILIHLKEVEGKPGGQPGKIGDAGQHIGDLLEGAKAVQHPELAEGDMDLGLVIAILVVAPRIRKGHTGRLLRCAASLRLRARWVHLDRKHLAGIEDLEEKGQPGAKPSQDGGSEDPLPLPPQQFNQVDPAAFHLHLARGLGMTPQPEFGEGALFVIAHPQQAGNAGVASPGIVHDAAMQGIERLSGAPACHLGFHRADGIIWCRPAGWRRSAPRRYPGARRSCRRGLQCAPRCPARPQPGCHTPPGGS
ncbi:MAG: hypothetical protein BWY77_01298 [bacterium ADurb.Bin431]|nr:MAG: hypothetical protein BWY77_01298 [bacterium ADurb.Bin431]